MIGRTYLERGRPVTVLVRWAERGQRRFKTAEQGFTIRWTGDRPTEGPRNVLIRREGGETVVRPFRG